MKLIQLSPQKCMNLVFEQFKMFFLILIATDDQSSTVKRISEELPLVNYPTLTAGASCGSSEPYPKIGLGTFVLPLAVCRRLRRNSS